MPKERISIIKFTIIPRGAYEKNEQVFILQMYRYSEITLSSKYLLLYLGFTYASLKIIKATAV